MANDLILTGNKALSNVQRSISVLNKLLPNSLDKLAWWNSLSYDWKNIFLSELKASEIEFNQKPDFYLEKLFNITLFDTTKLKICKNQIQDISPLGNLTQLTSLDLRYNQIQDISTLGNLTKLTRLRLDVNKIQDISALGNLTQLTELALHANQIRNISALRHLTQLISLDLGRNQIQDISPLATLENLETLHLGLTPISQPNIDWLQSKLPNCWIIY